MPVHLAADPKGGRELVRAGIERLMARGDAMPRALEGWDLSTFVVETPHAVFGVAAADVARGAGLEVTYRSTVRYIVSCPTGPMAAAEVLVGGQNDATDLININIGPYVASSAQGLQDVAGLDAVQGAAFEAVLLVCAAIGLMAIWLRSEDDSEDVLYPIAPTPNGVEARHSYSAAQFLRLIRPAARAIVSAGTPGSTP